MYVDSSGHIGILAGIAIGFVVGFLIGGGFEAGKQIYNGGDWN